MSSYGEHFARVAPRYDALREEAADEVVGWIVEAGALDRGQRLLDVGCGTGATTAALAEAVGLDAVGVDVAPAMLAEAERRTSPRCRFVAGEAERLPFADDTFDRALIQTAVHLMRRPAAFAEACRVLRGGGRLVVLTVDPAGVDTFWLAEWFPSYPAIDRARFPAAAPLAAELEDAGFGEVVTRRRERTLRFTRERALTMLRARFASSFALLDDAELRAGVERAEREMPATFTATLRLLLVTASVPAR